MDNLLDKTARKEKTILYVLSGVLPVIILGAAFALNGIYPFGGNQIIVGDFFDQYFPFASDYWHKLREGGSLLWSWTAGAGHDYYATLAYFIASPFNLLAALFPHAMLREVLTVFLLVKIGLAGLFMSMYLRYASMHSASRIKNQESRIKNQESRIKNRTCCRLLRQYTRCALLHSGIIPISSGLILSRFFPWLCWEYINLSARAGSSFTYYRYRWQ